MSAIKTNKVEKIILGMTFAFLLLTLGYFVGSNSEAQPYRVETAYQPVETLTPATSSSPPVLGKVDLNTADVLELDELPGIGSKRAKDIVDYRNQHGSFSYVEEITNVPGIGEGTLEGLIEYVYIS